MDKERTQPEGLFIPNVTVEVDIPSKPVVLGLIDGRIRPAGLYGFRGNTETHREEAADVERRLKRRDWGRLRSDLLSLDVKNRDHIAQWLTAAGYAPDHVRYEWQAQHVSDELGAALNADRKIIGWLMGLEKEAFRKAVRAAHGYFRDRQDISAHRIDESYAHTVADLAESGVLLRRNPFKKKVFRDPWLSFMRSTGAPADLDPWMLNQYLMGTGIAPRLLAHFRWDENGTPIVGASVQSPLEAIGLSVHIDRNFFVRQWIICANDKCKKGFERDRGSGKFCSERCKNYVLTNRRRSKVRALREAEKAWTELPSADKRKHNRWAWIANNASKGLGGELKIDAAWAHRELGRELS